MDSMHVDANVSFGLLQACTLTLKGLAEAYRFCLGHCFSLLIMRPGAGPYGVAHADIEKHGHVDFYPGHV